MVGIPTPLERGCGRLSYAGLGCSYDGHREGSHPMCEGALNYTCEGYAQSFDLQPWFGHLSGGWKAVDLVSLVSNSDQRLDQNVLRN
jgi:hypothetical protein